MPDAELEIGTWAKLALISNDNVEAGVLSDAIVLLGETSKTLEDRPNHPLRLVVVKTTPHEKRGGSTGPASNGLLLIATNLFDLSHRRAHLPANSSCATIVPNRIGTVPKNSSGSSPLPGRAW